jgi:asparagine synthase (glutamine-hydrolysing)
MPGVAGVISTRPAEHCQRLVESMVAAMKHESFYVSGTYCEPEMAVYAGWVAMDQTFASSQVFFNEQRDIGLILSGECFVDLETLTGLKQKGHKFETGKGDWLVHLYEEEGSEFFEKLNGLFSGLLVDKRRRQAYLFNDRYGMERLYWHETKDAIYFASEAKALLRVLPELRAFDEQGVAQFLAYGCTLEGRTLFQGIHVLPGGSLWSFENANCRRTKYFSEQTWESQQVLPAPSFEARFQETFKKVLPRYFESQARIGISLTGGLDTRMIMACRPETADKPICYTFSGGTGETLDDHLAHRVARACGLEHRLLRIGPDFFSDFASHVDRTVYITDGCFGVTGAHEIYLNREARQLAPVRLTGNYGSEVLRGVSTFKPVGLSPNLFDPRFASALDASAEPVRNRSKHAITFAAFHEIPVNLFGSLAAGRSQVHFRTPYLDNEIVALAYQAPESLRKLPRTALQVIKDGNPSLSTIPTDRGVGGVASGLPRALNRLFLEAMFKLDYYHNEGMPHWLSRFDFALDRIDSGIRIFGHHKFLHYRKWFRRELASYVTGALNDDSVRQSQFWSPGFLAQMARAHIQGRRNYVREVNAVLTLAAVERLLFRELPRGIEYVDRSTTSTESSLAVAQS